MVLFGNVGIGCDPDKRIDPDCWVLSSLLVCTFSFAPMEKKMVGYKEKRLLTKIKKTIGGNNSSMLDT